MVSLCGVHALTIDHWPLVCTSAHTLSPPTSALGLTYLSLHTKPSMVTKGAILEPNSFQHQTIYPLHHDHIEFWTLPLPPPHRKMAPCRHNGMGPGQAPTTGTGSTSAEKIASNVAVKSSLDDSALMNFLWCRTASPLLVAGKGGEEGPYNLRPSDQRQTFL